MKIKSLINCENPLGKLMDYGYLPARMIFYLSSVRGRIQESLDSYYDARNSALEKYGDTVDGINYTIPAGDKAKQYSREVGELLEQEVDIEFPPEKITLCIDSIDMAEVGLPPEKRLGFTAKDWPAIQEVIKVVETEE